MSYKTLLNISANRLEYEMTVADLIEELKELPGNCRIEGLMHYDDFQGLTFFRDETVEEARERKAQEKILKAEKAKANKEKQLRKLATELGAFVVFKDTEE